MYRKLKKGSDAKYMYMAFMDTRTLHSAAHEHSYTYSIQLHAPYT